MITINTEIIGADDESEDNPQYSSYFLTENTKYCFAYRENLLDIFSFPEKHLLMSVGLTSSGKPHFRAFSYRKKARAPLFCNLNDGKVMVACESRVLVFSSEMVVEVVLELDLKPLKSTICQISKQGRLALVHDTNDSLSFLDLH